MGESYSVEAVLTAVDKGFGSTLKAASRSIDGLKRASGMFKTVGGGATSMFKSMLGANLAGQAISAMTRTVSSGLGSMLGEMNSSAKAWKTFEGNLSNLGFGRKQILEAKSAMQDYATKTIYSASDMASTYAQMAAVGVKNTGKLVQAFGGLAGAAENPAQAMKTLSQQATQMAAKPTVQWQDFKLMLEQTPAGIAAVAKQMGKSTEELVKAVQDGEISTKDFFNAVEAAGNSTAFQKMATQFKTVDQAVDGLREGVANKLAPTFEKVNQLGIKAITSLSNAIDSVNLDSLPKKIDSVLSRAKGMVDTVFDKGSLGGFRTAVIQVQKALEATFDALEGGSGITGWLLVARNGFQALAAIISNVARAVRQFMKGFAKTEAILALKTAFNDTFNTIKNTLNSLNKVEIFQKLGKSFGDAVTKISKAWSQMVKNVNWGALIEGAAKVVDVIINIAGSVIPAMISALGALGKVIETIAGSKWFNALADGVKTAFSGISGAFKSLFDAVAKADPKTLEDWGATILSVVAGFKLFKKFTGKGAFDGLLGKLGPVGKRLKSIGSKFSWFGSKAKEGTDKASNGAKRSGGIISKIFNGLGNIVKSAGTAISTVAQGIGAGIKTALSGIPPIISSLGTAISTVAQGIGTGIKTALSGIPAIISSLGTAISTVAQGIGTGLAIAFKGLGSAIAMVPPTTWLALGAAILMVGAAFALAGTQADGISQILRTVGDVVVQILQQITDSLATLIPIIASAIGSILPIVAGAISQIVAAVAGGLSQIITAVSTGIATVIGAFTGLLGGISGVINSISGVIQSLTAVITSVFNGIATVISSVGSAIKDVLTGLGTAFEGFGNGVKSALEGVGAVIESFGSAVRNVLDGVANILDSMGTAALNAGRGVKEMAKGIKMLVDLSLGDLVATLAAVASGLGKMASSAGEMATLGSAMSKVATGMTLLSVGATSAATGMTVFATMMTKIQTTVSTLQTALTTAATVFMTFATQAMTTATGLSAVNVPIAMFKTQLMTIAPTLAQVGAGFASFVSQISLLNTGLASVGPTTAAFNVNLMTLSTSTSALVASITGLTAVLTAASAIFVQIGASATTAIAQIQSFASSTTVVSSAFASMQSMIQSAMTAIVASIITSLNQAASQMQSIMSRMLTIARTFGSQLEQQMRQSGQRAGQNLAQGLSSQLGAVVSAVSNMVNAAVSRANAGAGPMRQAGAFIGQGLAQGMYSALGAVTAAANALVAQAERAARAKAMIKSPSRLFANRVGKYIPQGVAMGIDKNADVVDDSVGGLFDSVNSFDFNIADRLASIGAKFQGVVKSESSQSLSQQQEFVHTAQPAYINFSLGGNEYEAFVSDITNQQAKIEKIRLKRSSW
ncbi:putative minor tail protein - phage associated [Streptococcus canis]|uniref:tape measure protein n=1 Tax=Streptococcus canis TaxID=1329 RepID=UPI001452C6C0|nr:tape measure protein [Streptococcus canis]GFK31360.1 putative minor tail protein - phage associated [Streptococcus canis]